MNEILQVIKIVRGTTVDGPGLRTAIYFAGCTHHCSGCHNPQSWDFSAGTPMTISEIINEVRCEGNDVTLTGGDPLMHPVEIKKLAAAIQKTGLKIWLYTGYTWDEISSRPELLSALQDIDVIVEGRFLLSHKDTDLQFRGSSNQRILQLDKGNDAKVWRDPFAEIHL